MTRVLKASTICSEFACSSLQPETGLPVLRAFPCAGANRECGLSLGIAIIIVYPPGVPRFSVEEVEGSDSAVAALPSDLTEFQVPIAVLQKRWTSGDHPVEQGLVRWSHMPPALSTWEPLEALRQQFPRAPAWGHAAAQEEGNVSDGQATPTKEVLGSNDKQEAVEAARPKRKTEPNRMLSGPEWSK